MGAESFVAVAQFCELSHERLCFSLVIAGVVKGKDVDEKSYDAWSVCSLYECGISIAELRE